MILIISILQIAFNITQIPLAAAEINAPGRGAQFWNGVRWDNVAAPQIPQGSTYGYTAYSRFEWDEIEPSQGVYNLYGSYPSLEFWIRYSADRGMAFAFGGVMSVCDGCGNTAYPDGSGVSLYPYYLHQMMQAEAVKDWKAGNIWIPNWNSPAYLARYKALYDTIAGMIATKSYVPTVGPNAGKVVRYKDVIDYVDIRGFGNFGEWHNYPYWQQQPTGTKATAQTLKSIVDISISAFPNNQLVIIGNAFDNGNASQISPELGYYVLTKRTPYGMIGWRRDNIGGTGDDNYLAKNTNTWNGFRLDTAITNRWKYAMITGEPLNGNGTCCPLYYDIRREIGLYHYAGFGNGNYGGNTQAVWDTMTNAFKLTGHRYQLSGSIDSILYKKSTFNIKLKCNNIGASPIYQKRWKVRYHLVNSVGVKVQTFTSAIDLYLLFGEVAYDERFTLGDIPEGFYKLNIIVEDTTGFFQPMPLPITNRNADGSYTVATLPVKNPNILPIREWEPPIDRRVKALTIHPNPAYRDLQVALPYYIQRPIFLELYDVQSRLLRKTKVMAERLTYDIGDLQAGVYILKIYNGLGIIQTTEKIIKWR